MISQTRSEVIKKLADTVREVAGTSQIYGEPINTDDPDEMLAIAYLWGNKVARDSQMLENSIRLGEPSDQ